MAEQGNGNLEVSHLTSSPEMMEGEPKENKLYQFGQPGGKSPDQFPDDHDLPQGDAILDSGASHVIL
eukprot:3766603-Amphidinium_carterae.1